MVKGNQTVSVSFFFFTDHVAGSLADRSQNLCEIYKFSGFKFGGRIERIVQCLAR